MHFDGDAFTSSISEGETGMEEKRARRETTPEALVDSYIPQSAAYYSPDDRSAIAARARNARFSTSLFSSSCLLSVLIRNIASRRESWAQIIQQPLARQNAIFTRRFQYNPR